LFGKRSLLYFEGFLFVYYEFNLIFADVKYDIVFKNGLEESYCRLRRIK